MANPNQWTEGLDAICGQTNDIDIQSPELEDNISETTNSSTDLIRNSFNRFGEDLAESILDFLPLKDKVIFKAVNRQFNRCLSGLKAKKLVISTDNHRSNPFNSLKELIVIKTDVSNAAEVDEDMKLMAINKIGFKSLLKNTFKTISRLDLSQCFVDKEIIELISTYCQYLRQLSLSDFGIESEDLKQLIQNCGKNLKSISMVITRSEGFNEFTDQFKQQLTSMRVQIISDNPEVIENIVTNVSKFEKLKYVSIVVFSKNPDLNVQPIDEHLTQLAANCVDLKELEICFALSPYHLVSENTLNLFNKFENLNTIDVCIPVSIEGQPEVNAVLKHSTIGCFKKFPKLISLSFNYTEIDDQFIVGIDSYYPNLKELRLGTGGLLTDKSMASISNLKNLKTFRLSKTENKVNETFYGLTDSGIEVLLNSKSLSIIRFIGRPQITDQTVDNLISKALENRKQNFYFCCQYQHSHDCTPINMKRWPELPPNLHLMITGPLDAPELSAKAIAELNGDSDCIKLRVVGVIDEMRTEILFGLKMNTKLRKVMRIYSQRVGQPIGSLKFLFDGIPVRTTDTADLLGMDDEDVIEVLKENVIQSTLNWFVIKLKQLFQSLVNYLK